MARQAFTFNDLRQDCRIETNAHCLDGRKFGARVFVPEGLFSQYPYNASAYAFMQELRPAIAEFGILEFPDLPLNPVNHTVAMRHPAEHSYSDNPYLNRFCQEPHQDTPPYPTAFWLAAPRRFAATWFMSTRGLQAWADHCNRYPNSSTEARHRELVPHSLDNGTGLLLTRFPGLILFDNSQHHRLYHARTCNFEAAENSPGATTDTPAYAFNEMGLLHYIDSLDSRRGISDLDAADRLAVEEFLAAQQP